MDSKKVIKLEREYAQAIKKLCHSGDVEVDHSQADDTLINFLTAIGCKTLVDAWQDVKKYYA